MAENNQKAIVLDTSALLTYIEDEDGAQYIEDVLIQSERNEATVYIAFISVTEVMYITLQEKDESTVEEQIEPDDKASLLESDTISEDADDKDNDKTLEAAEPEETQIDETDAKKPSQKSEDTESET